MIKKLDKNIAQYIRSGKYKEALENSKKLLELVEKYYGKNHPSFFSALNNFGLVLKVHNLKK